MSVLLVGLCAAMLSKTGAPVPVEEEPRHKTVLLNEYVQAFRVTLEPGESTLMHIHAHADAAVRLSTAKVAQQTPGQPLGAPEEKETGFCSARENEPTPLVHRVENVGKTVFDVLDVQVLARPEGPATAALSLPSAENARMRVYRYDLSPNGGSSTQHSHARPYLIVAATDVDLRMTAPDGKAFEHPIKSGDMHWVDTAVTHTLTNKGDRPGILVEIELK
jgi:hypothetical protein